MTDKLRDISPGDRVSSQGYAGEVIALYDDRAWVKFDTCAGVPMKFPFFDDDTVADLERIA